MPFYGADDLNPINPLPGWHGRYVHTDNVTLASYDVDAGSSIHEHHHEQEEVWRVIEGELEVTIAGETHVAGPGAIAVVPADTPHSIIARTAAKAMVVDYPIRTVLPGQEAPDQ